MKNGKYGLLDLEKGREVVATNLNGIYSVTQDGKDYYIAEISTNGNVEFLENYVKSLNSITANID